MITDAEAKLKSTDLTIQEIAYSLNFPDISFFGKYFKDIQECHRNSIGKRIVKTDSAHVSMCKVRR